MFFLHFICASEQDLFFYLHCIIGKSNYSVSWAKKICLIKNSFINVMINTNFQAFF